MTNVSVSSRERDWRAESDAEILAQYNEIINDPKRMKYATKVAQTKADEWDKKARAMKKVANKGGR